MTRRPPRPRDRLGRPLAYGSIGVPDVPTEALPPAAALRLATDLWRTGRPFGAHEVLEACWKAAPDDERALWQGLAQLAVGATHCERGNRVGGARLLARGAERIHPYADQPPHSIPVPALLGWAASGVAAATTGGGPLLLAPPDLTGAGAGTA